MEIITILFVTDDVEYAEALTTCITEENKALFFTIIMTEEFKQYQKIKEFDLILLDYFMDNNEDNYIQFTEKRAQIKQTNKQTLYRYDTAENLSKELTLLYCLKTGSKYISPIKKTSKMILFCSAEGGSGKTSVALALAQELTRFHGKKVLYINYEEVESTNRYFNIQEDKTISNFLYKAEINNNFNELIDCFTITDNYGIETFSSSKGRNPLKFLNIEDLCKFIEGIQTAAKYDYIFIDGDNSLNDETIWLISICDKVCKLNKWRSKNKQINFDHYLEHIFGNQIFEKIINIINFYVQKENLQEQDDEKIYIDYDEESFSSQISEDDVYTTINIQRDFGMGIRQLSTKLTIN